MKERFIELLHPKEIITNLSPDNKRFLVDALLALSVLGSITTIISAWDIHHIRAQGRIVWSTKVATENMEAYVRQANKDIGKEIQRDVRIAVGGLVLAIGSAYLARNISRKL